LAPLDLASLNRADRAAFVAALDGLYEHSPWVAEGAFDRRPSGGFPHPAALKRALAEAVRAAPREQQLALIRAHPELAGKAALADPSSETLTEASRDEQARAGLQHCSAEEFARLQQLNAAYGARFGWPFILAVRGPRGTGLSRTQIIDTFARRLEGDAAFEFAECLRQIHRIAELRLGERMAERLSMGSGAPPSLGEQVWDWAEQLAVHSDPGFAERGELTLTYLSAAHQAATRQLHAWMLECGFDSVQVDAVGNLVAVYQGSNPQALRLLTGSHFDTVRNGGRYDGRLGILVPMAAVRALHRAGRRLPFGIELVAFAEEEGQRWNATFLASGALIGAFDAAWLDQRDAEGVTMRAAMQAAGLPATLEAIAACHRDPARYRGFVEIHIEQGPVLDALDLPLGVVTSINGSLRLLGEVIGRASHAGTTPMGQRRDAAAAVAELLLYVEQRAAAVPDVVGTVGLLEVPAGSINVVPGRCRFSLDLRATTDTARDALRDDVVAELQRIVERRGLRCTLEPTMTVAAAPCDPAWQARWAAAVAALGLPVHRLPSGAGHDAMLLHRVMPQAMLFVRGGNAGISHNPLETITADDAELCVLAFQQLIEGLANEAPGGAQRP
jgi:beta-ureidopropionase / N-carbamoyl-L-amino-acid hydrolase